MTPHEAEHAFAGRSAANAAAEVFQTHRPRLFGVAYRMLGSRTDAEDLVQDAYVRWHQTPTDTIQTPVAFLVTMTTRLCIDRLRALKQEREHYIGPWLPEPLVEEHAPSPEMQAELAQDVSIAFLAVLERLGPEERAAFLLREVFDYDYPDVAEILGKSEAACRQMIHRARTRVREPRSRVALTPESCNRLLEKFLAAIASGEKKAVMELLDEEVEYTSDGGGKVPAALKVLHGPERIARLFEAVARRFAGLSYRLARVNGEPGAVGMWDGQVALVMSFVTDGERIARIYVVRNPDKLARVASDNARA